MAKWNEAPSDPLGQIQHARGAQVLRLDDWAVQEQPTKVDFVKMDVDGYEIDVIEGAGETLSRYKPVMMMEFAPYIFSEREGRSKSYWMPFWLGLPCAHRGRKGSDLEPSLEAAIPREGSMNVILEAR